MSGKIVGSGSCLCGAVNIQAAEMNTHAGACHCEICRKWGGGPFMAVDCGASVTFEGEDKLSVYESSEWAERGFCRQCGTHLFYRLKHGGQHFIPVGLFEDAGQFVFDHQVFIDKKPSYYAFSNKTDNLTEAEVFAKYASPE